MSDNTEDINQLPIKEPAAEGTEPAPAAAPAETSAVADGGPAEVAAEVAVASAGPTPVAAPAAPSPARRRRLLFVGVAVLVAVVAVAIALGVYFAQGTKGFKFDSNAQAGQAPYKTEEEIQAELDRIVEEGMFNISISTLIEFETGTSEGIAYIENVPGNRHHMQVTITLDETGEEVYKSDGIAPGNYVESITLSRDLDPGTYDATATFVAIDQETLEEVGRAAAKVQLVVSG